MTRPVTYSLITARRNFWLQFQFQSETQHQTFLIDFVEVKNTSGGVKMEALSFHQQTCCTDQQCAAAAGLSVCLSAAGCNPHRLTALRAQTFIARGRLLGIQTPHQLPISASPPPRLPHDHNTSSPQPLKTPRAAAAALDRLKLFFIHAAHHFQSEQQRLCLNKRSPLCSPAAGCICILASAHGAISTNQLPRPRGAAGNLGIWESC